MVAPLLEEKSRQNQAIRAIKKTSGLLFHNLEAVRQTVGQITYPFPSPRGDQITLFQHFMESMPGEGAVDNIITCAESLVERYPVDAHRILRELMAAATAVEAALDSGRAKPTIRGERVSK